MSKIYSSVDALVGGTPLLELSRIAEKYGLGAKLLAKLEYLNPAGSVKDRVAKNMIDDAEARGTLKPGGTIIEPTSGNTGIGLAMVAAARGYKAVIVMPDTMSAERINLMRAYGAEVVLTDGSLGMSGAIAKAEELKEQLDGSMIAGQFENPANPEAHMLTTGPEIYEDTDGKVDILVCGVGTGGTVSGTGKYLKSRNPEIKVVAFEPESSPLLSRGVSGSHKIQGIGANFVPSVLDLDIYDEIMTVSDKDAIEMGRELGRREGILAGISSGAAVAAAIRVASRSENEGKTVVVILPDSGDRYLSTEMFSE